MVDTEILFSNMKSPSHECHSEHRRVAVTSQPIRLVTNFMTLIPSFTCTELRVVSMEHLQRVGHASKERLPYPPPPPPLVDLLMLQS